MNLFKGIDSDDSGDLECSELGAGLKSVGVRLNERQLLALVHNIDADGNGTVSLHEFVTQIQVYLEEQAQIKKLQEEEEITSALTRYAQHTQKGSLRRIDSSMAQHKGVKKDVNTEISDKNKNNSSLKSKKLPKKKNGDIETEQALLSTDSIELTPTKNESNEPPPSSPIDSMASINRPGGLKKSSSSIKEKGSSRQVGRGSLSRSPSRSSSMKELTGTHNKIQHSSKIKPNSELTKEQLLKKLEKYEKENSELKRELEDHWKTTPTKIVLDGPSKFCLLFAHIFTGFIFLFLFT